MTPTEKQKCIAEQAVYGDLLVGVLIESSKGGVYCEFESNFLDLYGKERDNYETRKLILRPLSDLTKEITHKGYNNDEPFIPADIINKMELGTYAINLGQDSLRPRRHIKENNLLHLWHFDTRNLIERGEAVDVNTLDINPYSV